MMILITYDVNTEDKEGRGRLRRVAKECQNYGQRVQNSVFECLVSPLDLAKLEAALGKIIDVNKDSLRYYKLGDNWKNKIRHVGAKQAYDPEGFLVV
jgi:CRISPR-associated protein Cas2